MPAYFLRFVIATHDADSGVCEGVFRSAYALRRAGTLPDYLHDILDEHLTWLDDNLDEPNRFNRSKSKGAWHKPPRAISWFKPTAIDHIQHMREVARILNDEGLTVSELTTLRPGFVTYEDDFQVVAEPFADTPTAWR